ncbi:MAG: ABC transporter ATP-binding protein [Candidatus Kapaibacterium sp.]|nr:MAG: ABC transporter ATP-binding protein [Candidatus Kapabacteria bacterium]
MPSNTRTNFQRLAKQYLSPYRAVLIAGAVFVTLSNLCSAYYPRIIGQTVDLIAHRNATADAVLLRIGLILLLTVGSGLFMFATRKTIIVTSRKIEYELRRDFLAALERQSQRFYDRMPTGVLMAHATNDIAAVREFLGPAIMYSANTLTTFAFVLALMLSLDAATTGIALLPLPLIALATYGVGKRIYKASRRVQEEFSELTRHAQEAFSGIRIIRAFVREQYEENIFSQQSRRYVESNLRLARLQALFMPSMMLLVGSAQLLVLLFGGYRVMNGAMTIGMLTQFFLYIGQLIWPIAAIGWVTGIVQRSAASLDRIYAIMDEPPAITYPPTTHGTLRSYSIAARHVHFRYNHTTPTLVDLSFDIGEGLHVGIVGPIGSGKTTLLRLLARLYDPDHGTLSIGGIEISQFSAADLRAIIRVVPQEPFLFSMSIADNIRVGNPHATDDLIRSALEQAGIAHEVEQFPDGLATVIGERGILLSGGQRQRIAIARALIAQPRILLLDDALSAVDTATERHILSHLRQLACTTVIVSHRLSSIEHCDVIFVLEGGRIAAQGTHQHLLMHSSYYRVLFERQQLERRLNVQPLAV